MFSYCETPLRGWRLCNRAAAIALAIVVAGCSEPEVPAPPAKVAFENGWFRILDVQVPAGTTLRHQYPNDVAAIAMLDGMRVRVQAPGQGWSEETAPAAGAVTLGAPGEHGVQNLGESAFRLFALEKLRPQDSAPAEPLSGAAVTVAAESPAFRALDVKLSDHSMQVSHVHAVPAVAVLISGFVLSQGPESKAAEIGQAPTGLKQLDQRGQWLLVPPGSPHYLVRLGVEPAHVVELELR
jgi:hypothetical protein